MNMQPVESSNIKAIGWESDELWVEFANGLYRYFSVPEDVFKGLQEAESKGAYFQKAVRGAYAYEKIPDVQTIAGQLRTQQERCHALIDALPPGPQQTEAQRFFAYRVQRACDNATAAFAEGNQLAMVRALGDLLRLK